MGRIVAAGAEPWRVGTLPVDPAELSGYLQRRLVDLERKFDRLRASDQFGPVPGAYLTIQHHHHNPLSFTPPQTADQVPFPYSFHPLHFGAWANDPSSQFTTQWQWFDGFVWADILSSNLQVTGSGYVNTANAFVYDQVPSTIEALRWRVLSYGDGGSSPPAYIRALAIVNNVEKVENA